MKQCFVARLEGPVLYLLYLCKTKEEGKPAPAEPLGERTNQCPGHLVQLQQACLHGPIVEEGKPSSINQVDQVLCKTPPMHVHCGCVQK